MALEGKLVVETAEKAFGKNGKLLEVGCPECSGILSISMTGEMFTAEKGDQLVRRAIIHGDHVVSITIDREGHVRRKSAIPLVDSKRLKEEFNMTLMELLAHISAESMVRKP
jgi:hypothetical protein